MAGASGGGNPVAVMNDTPMGMRQIIVVGMMVVDFCYSLHLATMIKKVSEQATIKFDEFKAVIAEKVAPDKKKKPFYALHFLSKENIKEYLKAYQEKQKEITEKIKNKIKRKK